jgi:hypothetical protein
MQSKTQVQDRSGMEDLSSWRIQDYVHTKRAMPRGRPGWTAGSRHGYCIGRPKDQRSGTSGVRDQGGQGMGGQGLGGHTREVKAWEAMARWVRMGVLDSLDKARPGTVQGRQEEKNEILYNNSRAYRRSL